MEFFSGRGISRLSCCFKRQSLNPFGSGYFEENSFAMEKVPEEVRIFAIDVLACLRFKQVGPWEMCAWNNMNIKDVN